MKGNYIKPSELLKLQKETGKSYWDLIGRPLGKKPKDPAKDVVDEYDPVQREALRMQIESALDYPKYKGGKSPKVKTWNDNDVADLIIGFEGFLPHAKDIGDGKITIGSGLTNPKYTRLGTITPEQNRRFVLEEIAARKARLSRNVPGWNTLPGSAKAALLSYDYGWMVDRKTSPKMMKALQDRNWLEVSNQMNAGLNMKKFKKGLRKRRTQERNLFLSDLYRPAPLKPIQTVSPMPEAKVPFEVNQMEDKVAPIVNQQQPIIPYTSTVELPQEYTIPENDMASIDLESTSRIKPNDILQSYYNMFGYKRGKSFPFQFWNRANNTMRLQRFEEGKNDTNLVKIVGNEQAPYEQPVRFDEDGNLITRDLTGNMHSNSILLPEVTVKGNAGYNLANHIDKLTPWGLINGLMEESFTPIAQQAPNIADKLATLRYITPSYWIDRLSHSDDEIINGEGNVFGTGNGFLLDSLIGLKTGAKGFKNKTNIVPIKKSLAKLNLPNQHAGLLDFGPSAIDNIETNFKLSNTIARKPKSLNIPDQYAGLSDFVHQTIDNTGTNAKLSNMLVKKPALLTSLDQHSGLSNFGSPTALDYNKFLLRQAIDNTRVVDKYGNINIKNFARLQSKVIDLINSDAINGAKFEEIKKGGIPYSPGNIKNKETQSFPQHVKSVIESAQSSPTPLGFTRQQFIEAAALHDIGKLLGRKNHGPKGIDILKSIEYPLDNAVKNAISKHMEPNMLLQDALTRGVHFADVARGLTYDENAFYNPHTLYPRRLLKPQIQQFGLRDTLKKQINPVLKQEGYETIPLNSSEEIAEQLVGDRVKQHRTFLRSSRDPKKELPTADPQYAENKRNYDNAKKIAIQYYGENTPTTRLMASQETVPLDPTGSGRSGLFGVEIPRRGLPIHHHSPYSKMLGVDPIEQDALYISTSDQLANTYYDSTDGRPAMSSLVYIPEIIKNGTPVERMLQGDLSTYRLRDLGETTPMGTWSMFERPYRLQTGRSLAEDIKKSDPNVPKIEFIRDEPSKTYSPKTIEDVKDINKLLKEFQIDSGIPIFKDDVGNYVTIPNTMEFKKQLRDIYNTNHFRSNTFLTYDLFAILNSLYKSNIISNKQFYTLRNKIKHSISYGEKLDRKAIQKQLAKQVYKHYTSYQNDSPKFVADYSKQYKYVHDPQRMADFMKSRGVVPAYELESFNNPIIGMQQIPYHRFTKHKYPKIFHVGYVIGKKGEKVLQINREITPGELMENISKSGKVKGTRDSGEYSQFKVTRKSKK